MSETSQQRDRHPDLDGEPGHDIAEDLRRAAGVAPLLVDRIPVPNWAVLLAVVVVTFVISIVYRVGVGEPENLALDLSLFSKWYIWLDILNGVVAGYLWVAIAFLRRGVLRDLATLRPSLELTSDAFHREVRYITTASPTAIFIAGTCGALALYAMAAFDPGFWTTPRPNYMSYEMFFYGGRQVVTGWLTGIAILREVRASRGLARLGAAHVRIDLLDLRPLQPFAHKGLRSAATWLVSSSLVSLFWLSEAAAVSIGPIVLLVTALSTWAFLSPLFPLHNAIVEEKNRRLDRIREAIRADNDPLETLSRDANPHFANLVAYYNLIENAHEWPIETPTLLRLAAFATLGLGSWLGGAIVERLVESITR